MATSMQPSTSSENPKLENVDSPESDDDVEIVGNPGTSGPNLCTRSVAWDYYKLCTINDRKAICNLCSTILQLPTATTSPMINHLRAKHKQEWEEYNEKVKKRKKEQNDEGRKRKKNGLPATEKAELDELIMEMIALDLKPFSCVEDRGFKKVLKKLAPAYEPPSRTMLSRSLLPILYHKTKEQLMKELAEDIEHGLMSTSFTTDGWKSRAGDSYISLTLHYLTKDFRQKNVTLGMQQLQDRHTGFYLRQSLEAMISEWDSLSLENPQTYFVTDNARNVSVAVEHSGWNHIYCFAHTLQLALSDARNLTDGVNDLLAKARRVATYFHHSDPARRAFERAQKELDPDRKPLQLKQMVETRWNSEYEMLERMHRLKIPLSQVLANSTVMDTLSGMDWKMIKNLIDILTPLYEATVFSCGVEYPTLSMVIPMLHGITISLENTNFDLTTAAGERSQEFALNILDSLKTRFSVVKSATLYQKATFLDPRYKTFFFEPSEVEQIKLALKEEISLIHPNLSNADEHCSPTRETSNGNKLTFWDFMRIRPTNRHNEEASNVTKEIDREMMIYSQASLVTPYGDPLSWWKTELLKFPHLSSMARRYLAIPSTSAESERLFSSAGDIVTAKRTSLRPDTVSRLVFLFKNLNRT